jgi:hypothetical protein
MGDAMATGRTYEPTYEFSEGLFRRETACEDLLPIVVRDFKQWWAEQKKEMRHG